VTRTLSGCFGSSVERANHAKNIVIRSVGHKIEVILDFMDSLTVQANSYADTIVISKINVIRSGTVDLPVLMQS
jgi:hypothetical protein